MLPSGTRLAGSRRATRFVEQAGTPLDGKVYIRFTVSDGLIVRMQDFRSLDEAPAGDDAPALTS